MSNNWYINENTLAHHGIKGQKWGVRRYQNEDGTLTEAGIKKARKDNKLLQKYASKQRDAVYEGLGKAFTGKGGGYKKSFKKANIYEQKYLAQKNKILKEYKNIKIQEIREGNNKKGMLLTAGMSYVNSSHWIFDVDGNLIKDDK